MADPALALNEHSARHLFAALGSEQPSISTEAPASSEARDHTSLSGGNSNELPGHSPHVSSGTNDGGITPSNKSLH